MFDMFEPDAAQAMGAKSPAGGSNPELEGQWNGWLTDPKNRAALLSFGLQAMTGGWGGGGQQLAQAVGAGLQGYAGAEKVEHEEKTRQDDIARSAADKAASRAHQKELEEMKEKGRNARAGSARSNNRDDIVWTSAYNRTIAALQKQNESIVLGTPAVDGRTEPYTDAEMEQMGQAAADRALSARADRGLGGGTVGLAGGANAGDKTSEISPPVPAGGGNAKPGETPPQGNVGASSPLAQKGSAVPARTPEQEEEVAVLRKRKAKLEYMFRKDTKAAQKMYEAGKNPGKLLKDVEKRLKELGEK